MAAAGEQAAADDQATDQRARAGIVRAARHELAGAERATPGEFAAGRASSELVATGLLATAGQHAAPGIGLSDASVALDEEEPVGIDWSYNDTHWLGMDEHTGLAGIDLSALPLVDWDSLEIQEEKEEEGIIEICNEQQLYGLLGLKKDGGSTTQMVTESFLNSRAATTDASGMLNMQITNAGRER